MLEKVKLPAERVLHIDHLFARMQHLNAYEAKTNAMTRIGSNLSHGIAGLLGVIGFPIAALLLSSALGRNPPWRGARKPLLWIANLSWVSVILLSATPAHHDNANGTDK